MTDQRQWRTGSPEHRFDEPDLVPEVDDSVRRPSRALAGVIRIGSEDAEPWREKIHQAAPLPRGARIRVYAYDSGAGSCLAIEGLHDPPTPPRGGRCEMPRSGGGPPRSGDV